MAIKCLNLQDYHTKTHNYRKGITYLKNKTTTNKNQTLYSQKLNRKVLKHKINGNHPTKKKKGRKERRKEKHRINWKTRFKVAINKHLSIITLNVSGLNAPIKRHRVADWIKKKKPSICCLQETHLRAKDTYKLKFRGWEKIFHANGQERKAGVAILISDKIDFKMKAIKKDKEGHHLMLKGLFKERMLQSLIYMPLI